MKTQSGVLFGKEHYALMAEFEKAFRGNRLDKEEKGFWPKGIFYQDGKINSLFLAFRLGYSLGIAEGRE